MRPGKALFFSLFMSLFVFLTAAPGMAATDTGSEIRHLLNEVPPLASFPEAHGMVWKRHVKFRMLADGSLEKTTRWFILSGRGLPEAWRTWTPTVRPGGSIEVLESGIFDPITGRIVMPLLPRTIEGEGFRTVEIRSPELEEERLLCVAFREVIPSRYNVDGFLWTAFELPCWDQTIEVEVPAESNFHWEGHEIPEPSVKEGNGVRIYAWTVVNRAPLGGATVAFPRRPYLAFSFTRGIRAALDDLGGITQGVTCQVPQPFRRYLREGAILKDIRRFLGAVDEPLRRLEGVPAEFVRSSAALPGTKSWTDWERTLLAGFWLKSSGVSVNTYWLPRVQQKKDSPSTPLAWARPVLEIKPRGSDTFFWSAGQMDSVGGDSFSLFGQTLYRVDSGEVRSVKVPSGEVGDHRLILTWDLKLDATGAMEGQLNVHARGGWKDLLGDSSLGIGALEPLVRMPDLPHFSAGKPEVLHSGDSTRFEIPVSFNSGIPSGAGSLLMRFPSAGFPALDVSNLSLGDGLLLRFPFVVDQRYNINLPDGYSVMALPTLAGSESGTVRFSEELKERSKKGRLEGSFRMVVSGRQLDSDQARAFAGIAHRVDQWDTLTIPLKK